MGFERSGTKLHTTIGIVGCDPGIGVTHLAISLCNYCASKENLRCAYLELHSRNEVAAIFADTAATPQPPQEGTRLCYTYRNVDYYPQVLSIEIPSLLNLGYDYLIFDMGSLMEADIPEFLRCDRKLVYGSLASWKAPHYEAFFQQFDTYTNLGEGFCYLLQTGVNKTLSQFSKRHHIHLCNVPFINHPFHISRDLFPFFTTILSAGDRTNSISRIL